LGLCDVRKLDRAFTIMIRKMLHGANGIASFLGQHILLLPVAALIFNPPSRQSANWFKFCAMIGGSPIRQGSAKRALSVQIKTTYAFSRAGIKCLEQVILDLSTNGNAWNLLLQTSMLPRMRERSACSRQWSFNSGFAEPATQRRCLPCAV
jgi:hypothetical protein